MSVFRKLAPKELAITGLMGTWGCPVINITDDNQLMFECPLYDGGRCGADFLINVETKTFVCVGEFCHLDIKKGSLTRLVMEMYKIGQPEAEIKLRQWGIQPAQEPRSRTGLGPHRGHLLGF